METSKSSSLRTIFMVICILAGIVLLVIAVMYAALPANQLPTFFPGYIHGKHVVAHHFKHALVAGVLAVGAFAVAFFSRGRAKA